MKKLVLVLALATGLTGVTLAATATGAPSSGTKSIDPHGAVVNAALDGKRVAYALGQAVFVWNRATGVRTKVSGRLTEQDGNVVELAIAGSQVAWYMNAFGNLESDDYLFDSSLLKPKERLVAGAVRMGEACGAAAGGGLWPPACAGKGIGGVVASAGRIVVSRWTADDSRSITQGGLYVLNGRKLSPLVTGAKTVKAVAADSQRIAVLHADGTIGVFSAAGKSVATVTPAAKAEAVALSGRNLVVLEPKAKLVVYDAATGSLRKTLTLHAHPDAFHPPPLAVHNGVAVYTTPLRRQAGGTVVKTGVRALNLASGKDKLVGERPGVVTVVRINGAGLVYANEGYGFGPKRLVFVPFRQVAAAVS